MNKPKYTKKPKTFDEQVKLLSLRSLVLPIDAEHKLSHTNYYRLSSFWKHYLQSSSKAFQSNAKFEDVWNDYRNDRQLRLLIMDAIERIEVSFKTKLANIISDKTNSAYPYLNTSILDKNCPNNKYQNFLIKSRQETIRSTEDFVNNFFNTYDETDLPIWILVEILSFGTVSKYFEILDKDIRKEIANNYNLDKYVFWKWLHFLSIVRNMCCHHSHFWRRNLSWKPPILKQNLYKAWNPTLDFTKVYGLMCILKHFMNIICSNSRWHNKVDNYLNSISDLKVLGFPSDWETYEPWK